MLRLLELLNHGVYIQFDTLGMESTSLFLHPRSHSGDEIMGLARTPQAIEAIPKLIEVGYEDRILLSQDVCTKTQLKAYGGTGYSFVVEKFLPHLQSLGVTQRQIGKLIVENPRQALTFVEPK